MKKLRFYTIMGIMFVIIFGIISHFIYEWTGSHFIAGLFFPTNESTWEHMKLAFLPMNLYMVCIKGQIRSKRLCGFTRCKCGNMGNSVSVLHIYGSSWIFKNVA